MSSIVVLNYLLWVGVVALIIFGIYKIISVLLSRYLTAKREHTAALREQSEALKEIAYALKQSAEYNAAPEII